MASSTERGWLRIGRGGRPKCYTNSRSAAASMLPMATIAQDDALPRTDGACAGMDEKLPVDVALDECIERMVTASPSFNPTLGAQPSTSRARRELKTASLR